VSDTVVTTAALSTVFI